MYRILKKHTYTIGVLTLYLCLLVLISMPPLSFPREVMVSIESGSSVSSVANDLHRSAVVSSPGLFRALVTLISPKTGVVAGKYTFSEPAGLASVVRTVTDPSGGSHATRLTIPEGLNNREIAEIAHTTLGDDFRIDTFLKLAAEHEGYLFPETYFVAQNISEKDLVNLMRRTFDERIVEVAQVITESGNTLDELVTMAAILEGEAYTEETMRQVAGVLWHRIDIDMPLQVDAVFKYFLGRTTFELTGDDLEHESPYNTYENIGLPPSPINNPGLAAIRAAADYEETDHLFYLTGKDGNFYFAHTFEEHKRNKFRYLR